MDAYLKGEKIITSKDVENLNPEVSKIVDKSFDLNQNFAGFVNSAGAVPLNAPDGIGSYAWYFQLGTDNNRVELAVDVNEGIFVRSKSGKTGTMAWDNWKQIKIGGGAT